MRCSTLGWFLLSLTAACNPARDSGEIKQVQVTDERLKAHPADKPYVVEVSAGTLYEMSPSIDPGRVEVHGPAGKVPLSLLARRFAGSGKPMLVGTLDDLNARDFGFPPDVDPLPPDSGFSEASCIKPTAESPGICNCTGKKDCSDMNRAGLCTGGSNKSAVCGNDAAGKWGCSCVAKGS
ncbi:MAG TPA: hypothetical protein VJ808_07805 [Gemmatimonadales bacterium]|nr:hypothetical protein [Gemmatimonadales bacterium]